MKPTSEEFGFAAGFLHQLDVDPKTRKVLDKVVSYLLNSNKEEIIEVKTQTIFKAGDRVILDPPEHYVNTSLFERHKNRVFYVVGVKAASCPIQHQQEININGAGWWNGCWFKKVS